ncbi:recombinase family protein [Nocardiopsis flavescens]|uniref:recombinase family protein n=1 Tax=Nocardiopsis flavescens TaxID=758803 RepID=UPI0015BA9F05
MSTDDQTKGYGLDVQDTECTRFIEQQGWTLADLYTDDGVSGSLLERPEMDRLLADARAGRVDVVVVYKLDRIGRTNRVYFELEGRFKDLDVPIVSATQGVSTDSEDDELMVGVLSTFGQLERTIIRRRTQGGLQRAAEDGAWPGGMPPYGYKSQRRPRGQGKRGSFLVIDEAEAAVLRAAYRYLVEDGLDVGDTAARLNARGMVTRSGKPWSVVNLRARLLAESTTEARVVFRNPARASAGRGVKLDKDGKPKHGATVTISLPPIFEPAEVAELREALRPTRPGTGPERRAYPLSGRLFGQCGAHYVGAKSGRKDRPSGAGVGPAYKCRGRRAHHRGDSVCDDSAIPAHEMEQRVWAEVVALLGDAARLRAMAAEWVDSQRGADVDHAARVAELDAQIAERSATLTRTAADYMRAGVAPELVKAATDELGAELDALKRERDDAARWLAQAEQATARATDLEALAVGARERLADLGPDERAEVLQLLDVRVTVTGPVPMPQIGTPCSLSRWFIDNDRLVPAELDEEAWALVEPIVAEWEAGRRTHSGTMLDGRAVLNAVLFKARTRCTWREIPERYGNGNSIHTRWKRWQADGVWARIMDALPNAGTPHLGMVGLPPVRIEGRVDPRLVADAGAGPETAPQETGSPGPVTSAMSAGCHLLLRDRQAACVTCAEDVLDQIGPLGGVAPGPVRLSAELAPESARVLDAIPRSGGGPAVIARACGRDLEPTMRALGLLAAAGLVERCPAGWRRTR